MYRISVDGVNKMAQISLKGSLSALSLVVFAMVDGQKVKVTNDDFLNATTVKVELLRKNQSNATLVDMAFSDFRGILKTIYKGYEGITIPLALKDNLILSEDAQVLVSLEWKNLDVVEIQIEENLQITESVNPLSIKNVEINAETVIDSEFYGLVVFDTDVEKLESVVNVSDVNGAVVSKKQNLTYSYMKSLSDSASSFVPFLTQKNQSIKFFGTGKVYLIQI